MISGSGLEKEWICRELQKKMVETYDGVTEEEALEHTQKVIDNLKAQGIVE